ncbi:MAG: hypothetical protein DWQ06_13780 [Calditrichaeota bacterium]|nr:MAG: hypothetical protein DWQ06_13780 [Calditrichota bacterium]
MATKNKTGFSFIEERNEEEILSHSALPIEDSMKTKSFYVYQSDVDRVKKMKQKIRLLTRKKTNDSHITRIALAFLENELDKGNEKIESEIIRIAGERS